MTRSQKTAISAGIAICAASLLLSVALHSLFRTTVERTLISSSPSIDKQWIAVVEQEVTSSGPLVNVLHVVVRIRRADRPDTGQGLALAVEDGQRPPHATWEGNVLVVTLDKNESYLYFRNNVDSAPVQIRRSGGRSSMGNGKQRCYSHTYA